MKKKLTKLAYAWIKYLKTKRIYKHTEELINKNTPNSRCCLGHLCHVAGIKKENLINEISLQNFKNVKKAAGLIGYEGTIKYTKINKKWKNILISHKVFDWKNLSLAYINDNTTLSPKEIGEFIDENREAIFK